MNLHYLHGFLGKATDWEGVALEDYPSWTYDFFSRLSAPRGGSACQFLPGPFASLPAVADWINARAKESPAPRILIGYSLGGRLALHCLTQTPSLWSGGVIISGHPGLGDPQMRQERRETDRKWAQRFISED